MSIPKNTGYKKYTLLVEYSTITGHPTGRTKPNVPSDPNYIAPVLDLTACPTGGTPPTMDIIVNIQNGLSATIKLLFGVSEIDRTISGTWTVPDRTYDNVIFNVTANITGTLDYIMKVYYDNGQVDTIQAAGIGAMLFTGPFVDITKLELLSFPEGDFNDDFNNDYFN